MRRTMGDDGWVNERGKGGKRRGETPERRTGIAGVIREG